MTAKVTAEFLVLPPDPAARLSDADCARTEIAFFFDEMLARGVRLTTSAGSTAVPIAQTAIMGLLALARGFPRWLVAQRSRRWDPERSLPPADLQGQTAVIVRLGRIGAEIARLARVPQPARCGRPGGRDPSAGGA